MSANVRISENAILAAVRGIRPRREGGSNGLGRPNDYGRLAAVAALVPIPTAGRPIPKPKEKKEEKGLVTLDELKRLAAQEGGEEKEGA